MKQKIEIEVDVPDGYVIHKQTARNEIMPILPTHGGAVDKTLLCGLYLRKREPVRESRWRNLYAIDRMAADSFYSSRGAADERAMNDRHGVERLDYEDGKLVSVEMEDSP